MNTHVLQLKFSTSLYYQHEGMEKSLDYVVVELLINRREYLKNYFYFRISLPKNLHKYHQI